MRFSKKIVAAAGVLAAGSLALTGCSASSAASPGSGSTVASAADIARCSPAKTTLNVTFGLQASEQMKVAVAALTKKYPGLTVNATPQSTADYGDLTKTIVGDIAVGKRPDVIMTGLGQLKFWVDTYKPAPIDVDALDSTYQKQFLTAGTVDGTVYAAPSQISAPVLLVNQKALTAAGVARRPTSDRKRISSKRRPS
ncbi:hypothetical protein GCM10025867_41260 [Frondihabitans sucicola]|uniref:Extracellular solute-binding protein n=1 Tax=Frondihabitans sucicola TaxID=1268041 RepID=A0ABM8GTT3_9MICO|nr:extracellular solute-binding protein [Frondihabitans sucicola]BDZ51885.1 hypothetical protein GCM10025867_41260 [Frondihabitans sucicola]